MHPSVDIEAETCSLNQRQDPSKELDFGEPEFDENIRSRTAAVLAPADDEFDHLLLKAICADR
ncbi:hypothetical protein CRM90_27515 [Mycobacterium sp. ENV421]|nr:hypothetical protein CRM90_27515 [Mycobacterium sp. ENV421]